MAWVYESIDGRINLAIGLIALLIFLSYMLEIDIQENTLREECDSV